MPKIRNDRRITKQGKDRLEKLLNSSNVHNYHKTLIKGIRDRASKNNLSKADCEIFELIDNQYGDRV